MFKRDDEMKIFVSDDESFLERKLFDSICEKKIIYKGREKQKVQKVKLS